MLSVLCLVALCLLWPGVEVVKASTWEQPFYKRISAARSLELAVLKTTLLLQVRRLPQTD
jgi:hypothetical protein